MDNKITKFLIEDLPFAQQFYNSRQAIHAFGLTALFAFLISCICFANSALFINSYITATYLGSVLGLIALLSFYALSILMKMEHLLSTGIKLAGIIMVLTALFRLLSPFKGYPGFIHELFQVIEVAGGFLSVLSGQLAPLLFLNFISSLVTTFAHPNKVSFFLNLADTLYGLLLFLFGCAVDYNSKGVRRTSQATANYENNMNQFFVVVQLVGFGCRYWRLLHTLQATWSFWGEYFVIISQYLITVLVLLYRNPQLRRNFYIMAVGLLLILLALDWAVLQTTLSLAIKEAGRQVKTDI